ncbi:type I-E CRISPR-associated protein Cas5/CasD [bacterium]|nr:type I-E CRISPR-associated protein Cas5/CasD [bacterium]
MADNTLLLRLAGPMQSWGTSSKFQLRRTDMVPSKSGVLGLLLCAQGVRREQTHMHLPELNELAMGVRIDQPGTIDQDYHTAGAKYGIRKPEDGKVKITGSTKLPEVQLSRRQYLFGASFLVALQGSPDTIATCAAAMQSPVWPPYLGRKCCVPSEPIYAGTGQFDSLQAALASKPCMLMETGSAPHGEPIHADRECWLEDSTATSAAPTRQVYDTPQRFGYWSYLPRRIVRTTVTVPLESLPRPAPPEWKNPYGSQWDAPRKARLEHDSYECVLCNSPATQVHHLDYDDVRTETLRSLCELCHDACTMLEYAQGDQPRRIDPADAAQRDELLRQIERILTGRKKQRRRKLLQDH